jgi:hypothetical protein
MMPCEAMGTLLLRHQEGRMFVVPTAGITVDDAVALLLRGPYVNPAVTGSPLSDGNGQAIQAQLSPLVADSFTLGPGSRPLPETGQVKWLLPYHTIIEDGLDLGEPDGGPLMPGDQAEIHLVEVDGGILSVALVTDEMSMETFRPRALALAATVSLDGEPGVGCSDNGISRTQ